MISCLNTVAISQEEIRVVQGPVLPHPYSAFPLSEVLTHPANTGCALRTVNQAPWAP